MMKVKVFASLMLAGLPFVLAAQSNDDLYFVPKKKAETKKETVAAPKQNSQGTTVYSTSATSTPVVVKDVAGNTRDVDEYNRRYTSRENTFSMQNDTLYIQEKPYSERGEWVNGFEGTQDDYEYAMRIVRFRSPRYAIPVSSPLYWDVVYGAFPSWNWNVYDDGLYAYVFPTYSNSAVVGLEMELEHCRARYGFGWGWYSPWYYSSWYSPYWYGGYWEATGGYWPRMASSSPILSVVWMGRRMASWIYRLSSVALSELYDFPSAEHGSIRNNQFPSLRGCFLYPFSWKSGSS